MTTVVLDYGHGGRDPGATNSGRNESDDVLKVGKVLKSKMENQGMRVIETRKGNEFVSLTKRSQISNKYNPICFISLHRNAFNGKAYGVEVYTTSQSAAKGLAKKVQSNLVKLGFRDRGTKYANFSVLYKTKAPAILVELGFIDNSKDNEIFDNNINEMAQAILDGVMREYNIKPKKPKSAKREGNTLRYGSRGKEVIQLQKDLDKLGYKIDIGGAYGRQMEKVVSHFQSRHIGVKRDGIADQTTLDMVQNDLKAVEYYNLKK